ncbi:MAG: transketolase [Bacteroidales bacterium]|nr:transketolase [Bacteroidales bacterium]
MDLKQFAKELRLSALKMACDCGKNGSHVGSGLSSIEIMATLYGDVLKYDVNHPADENRDRLVVSKGHCVLAYYSALNKVGFLSDEDIASFETNGSHFHGHAMRNLKHGIEFSGGSLGMGMSFAVGLALSCKKKGLSCRVFALVGDGECDEGLIWEAAMSAAHYQLDNFMVIVDRNKLQYDGPTELVMNPLDLAKKFEAFGFDVQVADGHDCNALSKALKKMADKPMCVIADTVKGKGVSFMEGVKEWHHHTLSQEEYEQAVKEVANV